MEKPEISIIIPTFNSQETLEVALKSVLTQTFSEWEVLIMDGLSGDETLIIAKKYSEIDSRIRYFSEKDKGIYDAMNKGISLAEGDWLYFMGSDDVLYDKDVMTDLLKYLELPSDIFYGNVKFLHSREIYGEAFDLDRLLLRGNICHQAIFYNKKVFELLGKFNLKYKVWADWEFNLRCFKHPDLKIKYLERIICLYNELDGLSGKEKDEALMKELPVFYLQKCQKKISRLKESKDFQLGHFLMKPIRTIKSFFYFL